MSPRPNRFPSARCKRPQTASPLTTSYPTSTNAPSASTSSSSSSNSNGKATNPPRSLGPLAKAESYEDESESSPVSNIKQNGSHTPRQGPSYSNIISSYGRSSSSSSSNQSRVAISPLYCEQSVPTLQSPKNAVAPSDIIFERPPVGGQTTLMSYSSSNDYSNNVVQVKNALIAEHAARTNSHVNPVPLNLNLNLERVTDTKAKEKGGPQHRKRDIQFIDEETPSTSSSVALLSQQPLVPISVENVASTSNGSTLGMKRTQTNVSICPSIPDSITRSCSVGYLDDMMLTPSDDALSMLRREAPNKRLVLVDRKRNHNRRCKKPSHQHHPHFSRKVNKNRGFKKSKSLDSCDVLQEIPNLHKDLINLFQHMPNLNESSEIAEEIESSSVEIP